MTTLPNDHHAADCAPARRPSGRAGTCRRVAPGVVALAALLLAAVSPAPVAAQEPKPAPGLQAVPAKAEALELERKRQEAMDAAREERKAAKTPKRGGAAKKAADAKAAPKAAPKAPPKPAAAPVAAEPEHAPEPLAVELPSDDPVEPVAEPAPAAPAASEPVYADEEPYEESIVLNFENADIREVIYSFASALGINYWLDPRVAGQVTVRTSGRIDKADLFPLFHQLLRNNGFVAINNWGVYNIAPAEEGKTKLLMPPGSKAMYEAEDHFVMEIVAVQHVSADVMATTLTPFVAPGGDVIAYPRSNLLVITDTATNARRLRDLVRTFDTDTFDDMHSRVYKVEHAVLEDLAQELQAVLEAYHVVDTGAGVFIIPLARLNSLAAIAFDPSVLMQVEYWLETLDVPAEAGSRRRVYVYHVENSKAVDLAGVLNEIYSDSGGSGGSRRGRSGEAAERGLGLGGGLSSRRNNNSRNQQDNNRRGGAQQERGGGRTSGVVLGADEDGDDLFEQEVRIVEDEVTNSLVILATPRDYQTIRTVLRQLDIVPRQVLIEVMLAEVDLMDDESWNFNQALLSNNNADSESIADPGGTFFDMFGKEVQLVGSIGAGVVANFTHFRDGVAVYEAIASAVRNNQKSKVLSRPHIMTADNQEARILIGDEVPIITSQSDSNVNDTGGQTRFLQNVQYRDTGIIIRALPQVNTEGLVNMELSIEVSEVNVRATAALTEVSAQSPTFQTREAETTVVVNSGETIVIAGIIRETRNEGSSGVPYLMDIPVLGRLFRSDSQDGSRTELIVLITPFVVRDRAEAQSVTEEFKRRVDNVLRELDVTVGSVVQPANHTVILEAGKQ